ncbi:MAG: shikimate kinase [Clostridiales bacterium]|nr:shikimate kinase [Clostridiales bacterium]
MKTFGLLGAHLSHSFSPLIHSMLGNYEYSLFEKAPEDLEAFLKHGDFSGLNVTIPYKKTVIPYCDALSDCAKRIGSVNTLLKEADGSLFADNTDYDGFLYLTKKLNINITGKKALILGSGGSSLAVRTVLEDLKAGEINIVSRTGENNYHNLHRHRDAALIVNTTPVGMYPNNGAAALELSGFPICEAVIDIIYNPSRTTLLLDAEDMNIPCVNGLPMLVAQAKRAAEIFTGTVIEDSVIDGITGQIERRTKNIILLGMPGSGKSTTSQELARLTGREFIDTDEQIIKKAGKSIPEIFSDSGEEAFRQIETEVLREASKKSGCVIATGGGIVKRPENLRLIRQNGFCVFLDRDIASLPTDGRPLSRQTGVKALAKERLPLYNSWCDLKVNVNGVYETVTAIMKAIGM